MGTPKNFDHVSSSGSELQEEDSVHGGALESQELTQDKLMAEVSDDAIVASMLRKKIETPHCFEAERT